MSENAYQLRYALRILAEPQRFDRELIAQYTRTARRLAAWLIAGNSMP